MQTTIHRRLAAATRSKAFWPTAIFVVAVSLRCIYLWQFARLPLSHVAVGPDVHEYDVWARRILAGQILWRDVHIHGPAYPFLLAAFYRLSGASPFAARCMQMAIELGALACLSASLILGGRRLAGLVAAGLWAVYLPFVYYGAELVSEVLLLLLISASLLVHVAINRLPVQPEPDRRRVAGFAALGLLCGLATLTHPLSTMFSAALGGLNLWTACRSGRTKAWIAPLAVAVAFFVVIAPVAAWNSHISGEFVPIQKNTGLNVFIGNNPDATGGCYVRPGADYDALTARPGEQGAQEGDRAASRFFLQESWRFIKGHPGAWLLLVAKKLVLTWNAVELCSGPDLPEIQRLTPLMRTPLLRFGILGPLALAGIWLCRGDRGARPYVVLLVAYSAALALLVTSGRYRLGMVPGCMALAALGIERFLDLARRDERAEVGRAMAVLALGMTISLAVPPPAIPHSAAESARLLAEAFREQGDIDMAERLLRKTLDLDPTDAQAHHLMGQIHAERGVPLAALERYKEAIKLNPYDTVARIDAAIAWSEMDAFGQAETELNAVLTRHPGNAGAHYNLGVIAAKRGNSVKARDFYAKAIELDPALVSAHLNLGVLAYQAGETAEARRRFQTALRLAPGKTMAHNGLAVIHADAGETAQAAKQFERSLALDPGQPDIWDAYIRMLEASEHSDAAESAKTRRDGSLR